MTKLSDTNKDWKPLFVRVTDPNGFGINLCGRWPRLVGIGRPLSLRLEQKDFDELGCHECPWTLVLDREELDKFWLSVVLPIADPLVAVPIGLEF